MHWFKIYHGFSSDPKFALIAHQTKIVRAIINAIIIDLLEYASSQKDRGSILGYNQEVAAFNLGIEEITIVTLCNALRERGFIQGGKINNWDKYQEVDKTAAERQRRFREKQKSALVTDVTRDVTLRNTEEKRIDKKERKKEDNIYSQQFLDFWELYPRKVAKSEAEKIFSRKLKEGVEYEIIIAGVKRYSQECRGKDEEFIAHASTWLNHQRWADEPKGSQQYKPKNNRIVL